MTYPISKRNLTAADTFVKLSDQYLPSAYRHQIIAEPLSGATGVVKVYVKPKRTTESFKEALLDADGNVAEIDLSDPATLMFNGTFEAVIVDVSGITGSCDVHLESR